MREDLLNSSKNNKEMKPLVNKNNNNNNNNDIQGGGYKSGHVSSNEEPELKMTKPNVMSRHDSFDQKLDVRSNGSKRRRKNRSNSNTSSVIAGHVGSGIGSPRNMAENMDDNNWSGGDNNNNNNNKKMKNSYSTEIYTPSRKNIHNSNSNRNVSALNQGDVQIPIERIEYYERSVHQKSSFGYKTVDVNEYSDPRVAYRLASNENLF